MILVQEREALGVIAVRDTARAHSARTIKELKKLGIGEIVLLSGDHEAAVDLLAGEIGVDAAESRMLPGEKAAAVRAMKERFGTVAMVGDGVNDAPALAASTVGIAMGVAGSDAALETADIVLISDDLGILPHLVALSRRTMAIIRQNIAIALGIKLLFLVLSVFGMSTLWMALLADDGAALAVILNGLRILSFDGVPPRTN
jgi:Cd2+/Zn2+-exporting ATPase